MLPSQLGSLCVYVWVSGSTGTWLTPLACGGSPNTVYFGCWFLALEGLWFIFSMALFGHFNEASVKTLYTGSDESFTPPPVLTFLCTVTYCRDEWYQNPFCFTASITLKDKNDSISLCLSGALFMPLLILIILIIHTHVHN